MADRLTVARDQERHRRRERACILRYGAFDAAYYLREHRDVREAGRDPLDHYLESGVAEGRRPCPWFEPAYYTTTYLDVLGSGMDPLVHYLRYGRIEGRAPSREVAEAPPGVPQGRRRLGAFVRRLWRGLGRGRAALRARGFHALGVQRALQAMRHNPAFDEAYYLAANPDVRDAGWDPRLHYALRGWREGRRPCDWFDPTFYLLSNPDVLDHGIEPLTHYLQSGQAEGRCPSMGIDMPRIDDVGRYRAWAARFDALTPERRERLRAVRRDLGEAVRFSIVMPTYNTEPALLRRTLDSVRGQLYDAWELCIADDASTDPRVVQVLQEYADRDPRIRFTVRPRNGHICAASNDAAAMVTGDYVVLLDHDDLLREHALVLMAWAIDRHGRPPLLYSDEDKIDDGDRRMEPNFKPDFNLELLRHMNYICHLLVVRRDRWDAAGGFRAGYEGSQDHDLILRLVEGIDDHRSIVHLPFVLYHWRAHAGSMAAATGAKPYSGNATTRAVADHLRRSGLVAEVADLAPSPTIKQVLYRPPTPTPVVSVIIPTRNRADLLGPLLEDLQSRTAYPAAALEIVVVDHESDDPATQALLDRQAAAGAIVRVPYVGSFNFAAMNNAAVDRTRGTILLFLNNDIRVVDPEWLARMVGYFQQDDVGAVGAKLLYPSGLIQHAGIILGLDRVAGHAHHRLPGRHPGVNGRLLAAQELSACTAACLAVRRTAFDEAGGFDGRHLPVAFNDVDLCLKLRRRGHRIIWTPLACLVHHESVSRGDDKTGAKLARFKREIDHMLATWGPELRCDPAYNPNFSLNAPAFSLAHPGRLSLETYLEGGWR